MGKRVSVDELADAIMEELDDYSNLAAKSMKSAVRKASRTVKEQIQETAPVRTGAYAESWATRNTKETSQSLEITVYSKNRYQIAHLLEHGHAKVNGGRVRAIPHIAPAEQAGEELLTSEIERALK